MGKEKWMKSGGSIREINAAEQHFEENNIEEISSPTFEQESGEKQSSKPKKKKLWVFSTPTLGW